MEVARIEFEVLEEIDEISTKHDLKRVLKISSTFRSKHKEELSTTLLENLDVFSWTARKMSNININVACHCLNVQKIV